MICALAAFALEQKTVTRDEGRTFPPCFARKLVCRYGS
jgi:hypothetical protein